MLQLRSHTVVFLYERIPICLVPRNIAPNDFYVLFAGLNTLDIKIKKRKNLSDIELSA